MRSVQTEVENHLIYYVSEDNAPLGTRVSFPPIQQRSL